MKLIEGHLMNQVPTFIDEVQLAERIITVIIFPSLNSKNNSMISQKILKILE